METILPAQPLSHNHQTDTVMAMTESQPASENVDACSLPFAAGAKPHLFYKCLLNQHAQKLRKPPPVYQTLNEGFGHLPRFRSTVLIDGVSYTSSNTFQQRKTAEMDVSRIAYIAIIQKSKREAMQFIHEDKMFCKSILAEYAAKMNIKKPEYETISLGTLVPVFRSSLVFNGVNYPGDNGKSKKEAEQLVARAVIIKYLDSESGNDMADIVNCKFRQYVEMNKVQEINSVQNDTNVLGVGQDFGLNESGTGTMAKPSAGPESVTQPPIPSIEPITPAAPFVIQPPLPKVSIEPALAERVVLTQTTSADISKSTTPTVVSAPLVNIPIPSNVTEASPAQGLEYIPLVGKTSDKKRNRKNRKNAQKKMRADVQMPVVPASQVLPFSSQ